MTFPLTATIQEETNGSLTVEAWVNVPEIDRCRVAAWSLPSKKGKLASRLTRAVVAHAALTPIEVRTDRGGNTYLHCQVHVIGRTLNADLKRLGF